MSRPGNKVTGYKVVSSLLHKAAEAVRDGRPASTTPIAKAAHVLRFIDAEGQDFTKRAFNRSSGRIPKHMRHHLTPSAATHPTEQSFLQLLRLRGMDYKSSVPDGGIYLLHGTLPLVKELCGMYDGPDVTAIGT